jgi:hypothetical protein
MVPPVRARRDLRAGVSPHRLRARPRTSGHRFSAMSSIHWSKSRSSHARAKVSDGTYELDGPVLTLRYDSGAVVPTPASAVPRDMRRPLLAPQAHRDVPHVAAPRAHAAGVEGVPHVLAAAHPTITPPRTPRAPGASDPAPAVTVVEPGRRTVLLVLSKPQRNRATHHGSECSSAAACESVDMTRVRAHVRTLARAAEAPELEDGLEQITAANAAANTQRSRSKPARSRTLRTRSRPKASDTPPRPTRGTKRPRKRPASR